MLFCKNCGKENPEESKICIYCGADTSDEVEKVQETPANAETVAQSEAAQPPIELPKVQNVQEEISKPEEKQPIQALPKFTDKFHEAGKSTIYFVGLILFSAAAGLSIIMQLVQIADAKVMTGILTLGFVYQLAIAVMACTAGWFIYYASIKPQTPDKSITSMTLLKILTIIQIVLVSICLVIFIILSLLVFAGSDALYKLVPYGTYQMQRGGIAAVGFIILFITLIYGGIFYPYAVACLKAIKSAKTGLMYNNIEKLEGAKTVAVYTFIFAGFAIIGGLFSLTLPYASAFSFIIQLVKQAGIVLFAVSLLKLYNNCLTK